jgi:hypothetical protein
MVEKFTDIELAFITSLKEEAALEWADITERYNKKFKKDRSLESVKKGYQRNRDRVNTPDGFVKLMSDTARTRKANGANARDLKTVLEAWENREDILDAIKAASKGIAKVTVKPVKLPKPSKNRKGMTLELLISDVHVGKLTSSFNHEVLKRRLKQVSDTVVKEIQRAHRDYKVEKIIIAMLGDMIESATMHGPESAKGCEFGNSRQIEECQKQLFHLLLLPIFGIAKQINAQVDCIGVPGNHDRTEEHRTMSNPGEHNVTWIIYNSLKEFTSLAGFKNVNWFIPVDPYHLHDIYGEGVLYEHYDNVKGSNQRAGIEHLLSRRINQLKKPIVFIRGGHFHEPQEAGIGKIVINGNVPGNDGFSTTLGFDCEPSQTLNFYIEREKTDSIKRQTSFYKRFLIQLD